VTEFLNAEEVSLIKIHRHLNSVYGKHTVDVSTVRHWVRHFKSSDTETGDMACSSQPAMTLTADNKSHTDVLIKLHLK
jgi:hypothetical protein